MPTKYRRTREEVLEAYKACALQMGRTPGKEEFEKRTGMKASEVYYYWGGFSKLAQDAGLEANSLTERHDDEIVFKDFARICLHLGKIPGNLDLRLATRELKTKTHTVYTRFTGGIEEFRSRFRIWLESEAAPALKPILEYDGWGGARTSQTQEPKPGPPSHPGLRAFLPSALQHLNVLARGERPPFEDNGPAVETIFERRCTDAFRCLGFEIHSLGQGMGRKADALAVATREQFALIIDAKARSAGYVLGTEDRKFLEYADRHSKELQQQGVRRVYFVVVSSSFRANDWEQLTSYLSESSIRSITLITASALMRIVEDSIRERSTFSLNNLERELLASKIISQ